MLQAIPFKLKTYLIFIVGILAPIRRGVCWPICLIQNYHFEFKSKFENEFELEFDFEIKIEFELAYMSLSLDL